MPVSNEFAKTRREKKEFYFSLFSENMFEMNTKYAYDITVICDR